MATIDNALQALRKGRTQEQANVPVFKLTGDDLALFAEHGQAHPSSRGTYVMGTNVPDVIVAVIDLAQAITVSSGGKRGIVVSSAGSTIKATRADGVPVNLSIMGQCPLEYVPSADAPKARKASKRA